jgi:hypothetical protein
VRAYAPALGWLPIEKAAPLVNGVSNDRPEVLAEIL